MEKINFVVMSLSKGYVTQIHLNATQEIMEKVQNDCGDEDLSCYEVDTVIDHKTR